MRVSEVLCFAVGRCWSMVWVDGVGRRCTLTVLVVVDSCRRAVWMTGVDMTMTLGGVGRVRRRLQ